MDGVGFELYMRRSLRAREHDGTERHSPCSVIRHGSSDTHRRAVRARRLSGPATERTREIALLGESQQVSNFLGRHSVLLKILASQLVASIVEYFHKTRAVFLQFSLQRPDTYVEGGGKVFLV